MPAIDITLTINGDTITETVEPRTHLADFLRDTLGLTGTHIGCEHGVCGSCTVLLDDEPVRACLMFAVQAVGRRGEPGHAHRTIAAAAATGASRARQARGRRFLRRIAAHA